MPDYLRKMFDILGANSIIVPMGMPRTTWNGQAIGEDADGSALTVIAAHGGSGINPVFTYKQGAVGVSRSLWTLPTAYIGQGRIPLIPFNGTSEYLTSPDHDWFTMLDGVDNDQAFSCGVRVWITDTAAIRRLWRKGTNATATTEWGLAISAADLPQIVFADASAGVVSSRNTTTLKPMGRWVSIGSTYSGVGGAAAADGAVVYIDGIAIAQSSSNNASYVGMENLAQAIGLGASNDGLVPFDGLMMGGACGPWIAKGVQLTAVQMLEKVNVEWEALRLMWLLDPKPHRPIRE